MYTTYTGQLVSIRPFSSLEEMQDFARAQFMHVSPFWGIDWHRASGCGQRWKRNLSDDGDMRFAMERLDTGELCGWISARPHSMQLGSSIGTEIGHAHWSKGFGREGKLLAMCFLFENHAIESVWADTLATHSRARAGLTAIGFSHVGTRPISAYSQGSWEARVYYQIMREEWEQLPIRANIKRG